MSKVGIAKVLGVDESTVRRDKASANAESKSTKQPDDSANTEIPSPFPAWGSFSMVPHVGIPF